MMVLLLLRWLRSVDIKRPLFTITSLHFSVDSRTARMGQRKLRSASWVMHNIHYTRFPVTSLLSTCCGLVSDTANKSTTSRCNGIWEMTRHNRHNGLLPVRDYLLWTFRLCCGLVADLLQGSYQLVTDFLWGNWCNGFCPLVSYVSAYISLCLHSDLETVSLDCPQWVINCYCSSAVIGRHQPVFLHMFCS